MSVENLLKAVSNEISILKTARERYAKQLAPEFSVFNYIYTDEMMLSRIIADLLNPKGAHAQGNVFLKLFFEQFGLEQIWQEKELENAQKIQVEPEVLTDLIERKQRRIDILIKFKNPEYFLGIENKPFAADQYKQLEDYAMQLHLSCNQNQQNWHLIYLSGTGNEPAEYSVDKNTLEVWRNNQQFTQINYPELIGWLKQCVAHCLSQKVVNFLNEFQTYILNIFVGVRDMSEQDAVIKLVLESQENIKAATEIFLAKDVIQDELVRKFNEQLRQACEAKNWIIDGELNRKKESGVNIYINQNQKFRFRVQFELINYKSFSFGIARTKEYSKNPELWQKIHDSIKKGVSFFVGQNIKQSDWWAFYIDEKDIWNWQTQHEVWSMIQSGDLCERIMDYAEKTYEALKKANLLEQL